MGTAAAPAEGMPVPSNCCSLAAPDIMNTEASSSLPVNAQKPIVLCWVLKRAERAAAVGW